MSIEMPDFIKRLKQNARELNLTIAGIMQANRGELFDHEGAYNGREKWAPLVLRSGVILSDKGTLRKSLAPKKADGRAGPDGSVTMGSLFGGAGVVTIGTNLHYARLMNDGTVKMPGGVMRAKPGHALMIPLPNGKSATQTAKSLRKESYSLLKVNSKTGRTQKTNVIFRKSVKIPARPFDDWNDQDQEEMTEALAGELVRLLK